MPTHGRPAGPPKPRLDQIEQWFWDVGLDLLVDEPHMFLGVEGVERLEEAGALTPGKKGLPELVVAGQAFQLGPYRADVDGHAVRWIGRARR